MANTPDDVKFELTTSNAPRLATAKVVLLWFALLIAAVATYSFLVK